MREIKFRAWGPNSKYMWSWEEMGWQMTLNQVFGPDTGEKIIMQFTGLKDKNGVEIYEGDILHWPDHVGKEYYRPWQVEWFDESGGFVSWSPKGEAEIIGNIHESPSLLGEQNG